MVSFEAYAIRSLTALTEFHRTVDHRCRDMEALMATELTISIGVKQNVRELLMNQLRLYTEPSFKVRAGRATESNNNSMDRLLKRLKEKLFSVQGHPKTTKGRVEQDAQPKPTD